MSRKDGPGLDQVSGGENSTEEDTKTAYNDVGNAEEGVLATHDRPSGDEKLFLAAVNADREA